MSRHSEGGSSRTRPSLHPGMGVVLSGLFVGCGGHAEVDPPVRAVDDSKNSVPEVGGAGDDPPSSGGAPGVGAGAATGGVPAAGGAVASGGVPAMGGAPMFGGGGMDLGGASSVAEVLRIEVECAAGFSCPEGVTGSWIGEANTENGDTTFGYVTSGVAFTFMNVPASGQDAISFLYSKANRMGGSFEVRSDSIDGKLLATFTPAITGEWSNWQVGTAVLSESLTGPTTLVLVAVEPDNSFVANLDWIELHDSTRSST